LTSPTRDAALASTTARLLRAGRVATAVSALAVLTATGALLAPLAHAMPVRPSPWCWWGVLGTGFVAAWYAWRVELDAGLFADLGRALDSPTQDQATLADLDAALGALGLARAGAVPPRSVAARSRGARRLAVRQAIVAGVQAAMVVALLLPGRS